MELKSTKSLHTDNLKILVYGQSGAGKTSLAKTISENCLVVNIENGLLSLNDVDIPVVDLTEYSDPCDRFGEIKNAYSYLTSKEAQDKYDWVFIDSLTELAQTLVDCLKSKYPDRKDGFVMWGEYNDQIRKVIKAFRDLKGYNVVFTALSATDKDEMGRRFIGIDMPGKISQQVEAFFDEVFYLRVLEDEEGNKKRALYTEATDNFLAKDRSGKLSEIIRPDLSEVRNTIKGK